MKKSIAARIAASVLALVLTFGPCTMAFATETVNATRNSLKSQGNIVYTDGENLVEIYSNDLYIIADQLDSYKTSIANQLEKMHTYFTYDTDRGVNTTTDSTVNVTHALPASTDTVDPLAMDFDTLLEGLAASQSIPTDVSEYGYPADTKLYKTGNGTLTTDSTNATQIDITAATAENLSAGTAAWVNGNLILGTGTDNAAYYDSGKNECGSLTYKYNGQSTVTLSKGKYIFNVVGRANAMSDSSSLYIYASNHSITNSSNNKMICRYCGDDRNSAARTRVWVYYITVNDASATVSYVCKPSTSCQYMSYFCYYAKLQ
jgi:hypothetical protein